MGRDVDIVTVRLCPGRAWCLARLGSRDPNLPRNGSRCTTVKTTTDNGPECPAFLRENTTTARCGSRVTRSSGSWNDFRSNRNTPPTIFGDLVRTRRLGAMRTMARSPCLLFTATARFGYSSAGNLLDCLDVESVRASAGGVWAHEISARVGAAFAPAVQRGLIAVHEAIWKNCSRL